MIELTVKTLDSQNHAFSVPDDTTVKQLKERIAESISFPVESQRLIYCGRVLQDDKNLSEYDVNGKVIHLVQRPPPQATRNGGQQRSSGGQQGRRGNHHFRQPRLDGNAMYLGAMAFPADLMDAQGIQAPPSSHNLSDSRMLLARRMLRRASVVLNRLENPTISEASDPDSPPEEQQQETASSAASAAAAAAAAAATQAASAATQAASAAVSAASAIAEAASGPSSGSEGGDLQSLEEGLQQGLPLAQAAQAATAAAIAAAVSAAHAAGVPNITIVRSGSGTGTSSSSGSGQAGPDVDVRMEGVDEEGTADQEASGSQSNATVDNVESSSGTGVEGTEGGAAVASTSTSGSASASASASSAQAGSSSDDVPRTTVLADLLDELNRVNTRLQPFMQQYHSLMRDYPNPENNASTQESQRVFSSVSEIMHFLSHAYHALSDIMCDFTQPPPRALRCRPVLIQHSAVLQAGIPIQAQINVMTNRNNPNNNNNISTNNNGGSASAQGSSPSAVPVATAAASEPESVDVAAEHTSNTAAQDSSSSSPGPGQPDETRGSQEPAFNITPGNVEFFMEVGPGSITIDSLEATVVTNSGSIGDGIQANVVGGSFPWGAPPPPEFIQNLMQAVAGHMIGRGGGGGGSGGGGSGGAGAAGASTSASASTSPSSTSSTSTSTSGAAGTGGGGQNSQARGNTATHPTTATQTRSTARPHVHLAPATVQGLGASGFDPFLPCNSHHIRSRTRTSHTLSHHLAASPSPSSSTTTATTAPAPTATVDSAGPAPSNASASAPADATPATPTSAPQPQTQPPPQSQSQPQPQSQSQPHPHPQPQSQSQNQQPQSVAGILNMLSNIFGSMPTGGAAATVNLSNLFQPMMPQQQQQRTSTTQASGSQGAMPFPPGMAFFNLSSQPRYPAAQPQTQAQPQAQPQPQPPPQPQPEPQPQQQQSQQQQQQQSQPQPESSFFQRSGNQSREALNSTMLAQLFQGMSNIMGSDLFNLGNMDGNLADLLMTDGQHGYRPGTSLILDFLMTMGRNMSFADIINLTFGNGESLNRIRPQMRQFLVETAFENQPVTSETTARVVERFVQEIRPHLQIMQQVRLREDVDLVTTTIRYNQIRIPELISLIVEGNEVNFGHNMVRWFTRYLREISAIVLHCCLDGEQGLDRILRGYVAEVTRGIHPALQVWTTDSFVSHMQGYMQRQNVAFDEIREYLVYRVHPVQTDSGAQQRSFSTSTPSSMKTDHSSTPTPEPMDTDPSPEEAPASTPAQAAPVSVEAQGAVAAAAAAETASTGAGAGSPRSPPLPPLSVDGEPLPDVVLGSEAWHNVLPSEWVPIIARDSQRQRRQNPQTPFSDAYLSGMPSKRRKVVTSAKPQGNLNQIITESMRSALDEAGVRPVAGVETAGEDLELQAAYREQVRSAVQDSLSNNPDFTPERFPNATKYFSK